MPRLVQQHMVRATICLMSCAAAGVLACTHSDTTPMDCRQPIVVGVIIFLPPITLQVRDPYGHGQAFGTTAVARRAGDTTSWQAIGSDTLDVRAGPDLTGTYSVTLTRPYYQQTTISGIQVAEKGCSLGIVTVPVTMQLQPGAPPLRSMMIVGQVFLTGPGVQGHLAPYFDADPSVTRAVTWHVSDTTLATIDPSGVITAQCSKSGGTVTATATSVYDTTVTASVQMGVAPAASCP